MDGTRQAKSSRGGGGDGDRAVGAEHRTRYMRHGPAQRSNSFRAMRAVGWHLRMTDASRGEPCSGDDSDDNETSTTLPFTHTQVGD